MENKKIVEVFIETDEEEESFSSSSDESEEGGGASTTEEKMEQSHKVPGDKPAFYTGKPTSECPPVSLPGLGESLGGFETSEQASFDLYDREDSHGAAATMEVNVEDLSSESDSGSDSSSTSASPSPLRSEKSLGAFEGGSSHVKLPSGFERGETKEGFSKSELETGDRAKISMGQEQTGAHTRGDRSKTFGGAPIIDPSKFYCICQQPAQSYGMIQCHDCCDWFHGSCVEITRQKALIVKQFYCPLCIDKDPSLVTVFFEKKENKEVEKEVHQKQPRKPTGKKGVKKHSRRCGECVACLREVDCRKCRFCKDMPKYGGVGRIRQKCIKRQCLKYSRILYAEDPLHSKKRVWQQDIAAELKAVGGELADVNEATSTTSVDDSIIETSSQETASADFFHKKPEEDEAILESSKTESESVTKSVPSQQKSKSLPKKKPAKRLGRGRKQKRKGARKSFAKTTKTRLSTSDFDVPVSQVYLLSLSFDPFHSLPLPFPPLPFPSIPSLFSSHQSSPLFSSHFLLLPTSLLLFSSPLPFLSHPPLSFFPLLFISFLLYLYRLCQVGKQGSHFPTSYSGVWCVRRHTSHSSAKDLGVCLLHDHTLSTAVKTVGCNWQWSMLFPVCD